LQWIRYGGPFQTAIQPTGMLQLLLLFAALAAIFAALVSLDEDRTQKMHLSSPINLAIHQTQFFKSVSLTLLILQQCQ